MRQCRVDICACFKDKRTYTDSKGCDRTADDASGKNRSGASFFIRCYGSAAIATATSTDRRAADTEEENGTAGRGQRQFDASALLSVGGSDFDSAINALKVRIQSANSDVGNALPSLKQVRDMFQR